VTVEESLQIGIEMVGQGRLSESLKIFDAILKDHPDEPRTLFNTAVVLHQLGQRGKAISLLHRSMEVDTAFANPHYYLGLLYLENGKYADAYQSFRNTIARDVEFEPAYKGVQAALSAMGRSVLPDSADIVFYTGGPSFHGKTLEERGLGGSESALIYIARALSEMGRHVHVFCNCERPGVYDGVRYDDLIDFHIYRKLYKLPVLISSRSMRPFRVLLEAQARILWTHDDINVAFMEDVDPSCLPIDRIFTISSWQRDEWSRHYGICLDKFFLTRNGVDISVFHSGTRRERFRLVYTNRPNRGLDVLLDLFPHIRRQVPDAELHIFTYYLPGDTMESVIRQKIQQPGVYMRGSLPKVELAREIASARLMVYPSTFRETSCIAAIEAQAVGTPVVASTLAALSETVLDGISGRLVSGDPRSVEFGHNFVETVVTLLKDDSEWQRLSQGARSRCEKYYDWRIIAKEWLEEIQRIADDKKDVL